MDIREQLIELFKGDEEFVNDFLNGVNASNEETKSRIKRALADENSTEVLVEEVVEEVVAEVEDAVEEVVVEDEVEATEEVEEVVAETEVEAVEDEAVEDEVIEVELGESFIADLVGSDEFRSIVGNLISEAVSEVEARYEEQLRQAEQKLEDAQEWVADVPVRTKRAKVSFRPRQAQAVATSNGVASGVAVQEEILTMAETAENSVNDIFGGK